MAQSNWEADKMLDVYIYDYLLKRNLQASAKAFMTERKIAADTVAIDAPGGFLFEWWSVFWDIFIAKTNEKHSEVAAAYIEAQQMKVRGQQQQLQMQQLQLMQQRHAQLQQRDPNHPSLSGPPNAINSMSMLGSTASVLAAKMYEDRMKHPHSGESEAVPQLLAASGMALLKSPTNQPGQLVQGTPGSVSMALQQIQAQSQQTTDIKGDVNLSATQRTLTADPSIYGPGIMQSKAGLSSSGLNQGVNGLPVKGWPLNGVDQLCASPGQQVQKPFLQTPNQFQLLSPQQQQQILAQAQARVLPRGSLSVKDVQSTGNDGSIGSLNQSNSPKVRVAFQDQAELLMKMAQIQQSSVERQQGQLQQQQLQQNNRKRKQLSSGAANSTGTGNTADGTGGLRSSSNQLEDMDHFVDVGSLDDNVESFLSHDDGDARDVLFGTLKRSPTEHTTGSSKGFTFNEFGCLRSSNNKVVCCDFSSNGKLLASAGHEKKAVLWNMDTLKTESTPEEHSLPITDVRFRPNSTQLATSSFDGTVRLWDADDPSYCRHKYTGHNSHVMSLDFHPKKVDLLCSCDSNGEIRFWSINQYKCTNISKGGTTQVRFQPRLGQLLAASAENMISIFDVDTDRQTFSLQGHMKGVNSVCWDADGDYLASVCEDSVRVWSIATGGECIHELSSNGNKFHSCIFHPSYSTLLVIGGYQSLELWNMAENKSMTVPAHDGLIAALAQSPVTGMVASASHDKCVKLWK